MTGKDAPIHDWQGLVRTRLAELRVDPARAADIVDELALHVAQHHAELVSSGLDDADALRRALAPLDRHRQLAHDLARADRPRATVPPPPAEGGRLWSGLGRDFSYAIRLLRRSPGFASAAVVTLALGIGANATIFTVLQAVLLNPLPYRDPSRLVYAGEANSAGQPSNSGYSTYVDWQAQTHTFDELAIIRSWTPTLVANGEPERVSGLRVSANFFRMLGVSPALGRDFEPADDTEARWRVVVISDGLWRRRFGGDPAAVGRTIRMDDADYQVIGIMPATFQPLISQYFYERADMWAALGYDITQRSACRSCQHLKVFGRIRRGVSVAAAERDLNDVHARLVAKYRDDYPPSSRIVVAPLAEVLTGGIRPALTALMGAVAFVLLIACANVANLLLARVARRQHDLAMRAALGASRARIVRQLLAESAVLAGAGGVLGVALAVIAVPLLVQLAPVATPRLAAARVDVTVVGFGVVLALATCIGFGLLPALQAARGNLSGTLAGDNRRTAAAPTSAARRLLIGVDVALAVVLLAGAGLMIRSVEHLIGVNPGFDPEGVLTMQISMAGANYAKDEQVVRATEAMLASIRSVPGVVGAATAGQIPLGGNYDTWGFHVEGRPVSPDNPSVERYSVTPDYFTVMRIPLKRGRLLTDADRSGAERVMVIGEETARTVWPGGDPLGQHVRIGGGDGPVYTIVGIAGDVRHRDIAQPPTPQMYQSQWQAADSFLTIAVRTTGNPARLTGEVRRAIWAVAPEVPIYETATLPELVARSVGPRRFVMILLALFGAIALLMTAIGVYGVIAYSVAERTREIGVRAALGASAVDIARLILSSGMKITAIGLLAGTVASIAATRLLESSLFGVSPTDPATFAMVVVVLLLVTIVAQIVPVVRAVRIDPALALRAE
jgi:putative ABC transport system permease protein